MKLQPIPEQIMKALTDFSTYIIIGHEEPDGDCASSQLALASFLTRRGKKTITVAATPVRRREIMNWQHKFEDSITKDEIKALTNAALVVVDCSTPDRLGNCKWLVDELTTIVIDHHATGKPFGTYTYIDPKAPSTTILIQRIIESVCETITKEEADYLLYGLSTDTGFFRHIESSAGPLFSAVGRLTEAGASVKHSFLAMHGGKSLATTKLTASIISRVKSAYDGRLLYTFEYLTDTENNGGAERDSNTIYQLLQNTKDCQAILLIKEENNGSTIGLRSKDRIDVSRIALKHGGGGHKNAAGCSLKSPPEEALATMLHDLRSQFE